MAQPEPQCESKQSCADPVLDPGSTGSAWAMLSAVHVLGLLVNSDEGFACP